MKFCNTINLYTYVANNPIKYTDPDGRWISEFEADPNEAMYELMAEDGGDPDCPECEGDMLPGVTITANRPFMKEDAESITTLFKALAEVKERERSQFEANLAHKETGSCTPTNDELNLIPYEKLAAGILGITKLAAPFIVTGVKWGKPAGKLTYAATKVSTNLIPRGNLANHLFKGARKLVDTPANRALIEKISNGKALGVDPYGKSWFWGIDGQGQSIYTYAKDGVVKGAGYASMTANDIVIKYGLK